MKIYYLFSFHVYLIKSLIPIENPTESLHMCRMLYEQNSIVYIVNAKEHRGVVNNSLNSYRG
jgi:hypothetical protein